MFHLRFSRRWAIVLLLTLGWVALYRTRVARAAGDPVLTSVTAVFDTTTNDKDHDTYLDVFVYNIGEPSSPKNAVSAGTGTIIPRIQ